MKTIIATIIIFVLSFCNCFAGELPTITVVTADGNILCEADTAQYEGKFGTWTFFDEASGKTVEARADEVRVHNMNGEYVVRDGAVFHRNSATKKELRMSSDAFGETLITTGDDNFVVNNEL